MAYTPHGHYIRGSVDDEERPNSVARCGGPGLCNACAIYVGKYNNLKKKESGPSTPVEIKDNYPERARRLVFIHVNSRLEKTDTHVAFKAQDVYVIWHCKTLQHWKALVSTDLPDGMYYEVTYNGDTNETYIDSYKKFDHTVISCSTS